MRESAAAEFDVEQGLTVLPGIPKDATRCAAPSKVTETAGV